MKVFNNNNIPSYSSRRFTVALRNVPVYTGGTSPINTANFPIPSGITRWMPITCIFREISETGAIVAATFSIISSGGTTLVPAAAISGLIGVGAVQSFTVSAVSTTDTSFHARQTIDALLNSGVVDIFVEGFDLT